MTADLGLKAIPARAVSGPCTGPGVTALVLLEVETSCTARSYERKQSPSRKSGSGVLTCHTNHQKFTICPESIQERQNHVSRLQETQARKADFPIEGKSKGLGRGVSGGPSCHLFHK